MRVNRSLNCVQSSIWIRAWSHLLYDCKALCALEQVRRCHYPENRIVGHRPDELESPWLQRPQFLNCISVFVSNLPATVIANIQFAM